MEKRHRSSNFKEKYYFYEKSQNLKEYNHPKKRRQIQVRSLVMKNIRLKPVMTSSAIRVLRKILVLPSKSSKMLRFLLQNASANQVSRKVSLDRASLLRRIASLQI